MSMFGRWRVAGVVCVGLLSAFAAIRAQPLPPSAPPQPVLPTLPPLPGGAVPSPFPFDNASKPGAHPPLPPLPVGVTPTAKPNPVPPLEIKPPVLDIHPQPPTVVKPPVAPIPEPAITEPVATVHRFKGEYLGGDGWRAMVYVETGDGKAEVQCVPVTATIPPADAAPKEDVRRVAVPSGKPVYFGGKVYIVAPRELVVIDADCRIDWKFTLPGSAATSERLMGVSPSGNNDGTLHVTSYSTSPFTKVAKPGRVYVLTAQSGSQVGFALIANNFDEGTAFFASAGRFVYTGNSNRVKKYDVESRSDGWTVAVKTTDDFRTPGPDCLFTATEQGVGAVHSGGFEVFIPEAKISAGMVLIDSEPAGKGTRVLIPSSGGKVTHALTMFHFHALRDKSQAWQLSLTHPVTAPPVVRGDSVYFVSGSALYRVSLSTGATHWKHTLALNAGEGIGNLAFVGTELHASGTSVLVRIAERAEPKPHALFGGQMLFGSP